MRYTPHLTFIALSAALAACSPSPRDQGQPPPAATTETAAEPAGQAAGTPTAAAEAPGAQDRILKLSGLGALRIGAVVPAGGSWAAPAGAAGDGCQAVRSADYPGVYALVEGGKVRRITVGQGSDVKLVEGVGVGAPESDVQKWFAGFRSEPHKYEDAPAKYLTAPNAPSGDPALRFEIGADGKVKQMHVGQMPQLAYVEGCG